MERLLEKSSDGSRSKVFARVESAQFFVAMVRSAIFGLGLGFPLKISIFYLSDKKNIVGSGQKVPGSKTDWPFIYYGSKVCSGRVGSGRVSPHL